MKRPLRKQREIIRRVTRAVFEDVRVREDVRRAVMDRLLFGHCSINERFISDVVTRELDAISREVDEAGQ